MDDAAVIDTTSTTTTASPAASPSSAPASEPTIQSTTDRPSFGEALDTFNEAAKAQGKRTRGVKAAPTAPAQPEGAATVPAAAVDATLQPPAALAAPGPVPLTVHTQALENARVKERQRVEQEYRSQFGAPETVRQATAWFQSAARDRVGFLTTVINEALADPELGPQVLSLAGRTLSGNGARAPQSSPHAPPPDRPGPDFTDGQGNSFYSAKTQDARDNWLIAQVTRDVLAQVQPDLDQVRSDRQQQAEQHAQQQASAAVQSHVAEARKSWPYFERFKAEILHAASAMPLTDGHPASEAVVLRRAYDSVVLPQLSSLEQARVVADLKARANASSLNPASTGAPGGVPKNVAAKTGGTFGNALKYAAAQASGR